mgnify:CR=1 FL=1
MQSDSSRRSGVAGNILEAQGLRKAFGDLVRASQHADVSTEA